MSKSFLAVLLVVFGALMGGLFVANFGLPDWATGGRADKVVLGRTTFKEVTPPALNDLNRAFREVSQSVKPSVVYINVIGKPLAMPNDQNHRFQDDIPGFQRRENSAGSGVIISKEGYILTNHHVVEGGEKLTVLLDDKREFEAQVIGTDPSTDLAVVKIQPNGNLPVAPFGDDRQLAVGDWVIAIGSPFRLTSTVTAGIVSALGRQIGIIDNQQMPIEDFIQTDAAINPGNSGGALVNMKGELVGINTAIATENGSYEGYGFAVPIGLAARVAQDLIAKGKVQRGYLGVAIGTVTAEAARQLHLPRIEGVVITEVYPSGAAARAGLQSGDVILRINGREVNETNQLQRTVAMNRPGDQVSVEILRSGQQFSIPVTLLSRENTGFFSMNFFGGKDQTTTPPQKSVPPANLNQWGIQVRAMNPDELQKMGLSTGVLVEKVENGKPIAKAGLPVGAVITQIEEQNVTSPDVFRQLLGKAAASGGAVLFKFRKPDGKTGFVEIQPPR